MEIPQETSSSSPTEKVAVEEGSIPRANGRATSNRDTLAAVDEWDAAKVPPSRFQKRKGSIYATPGSRDGHVDRNYQSDFHEKLAEKGYNKEGK